MKDIEGLVRPNIARLSPYSTARDEYQGPLGIFLDANESPYETGWNRYPDPHQKVLKARISEIKGVPVDSIFLGNGSDEAIDLVFRVFCVPCKDNVVAISPSYGMYQVAAQTNDIEVRNVPLEADFSLDSAKLLAAADACTKAIFLCSPNNPSGNAFPVEQILDIVERFDGLVVLDEAYADFSSIPSLAKEACTRGNLIVLQTLSKARGMAALRLGMAFSTPRIIELMSMVKYPYNINQAAQSLVLKQLEESVETQVEEIKAERALAYDRLAAYPFISKVFPSEANFLLVRTADADALYDHLIADGIIVRNRNRIAGCEGCLRITIGTPEENRKLYKSLETYEEGNIR